MIVITYQLSRFKNCISRKSQLDIPYGLSYNDYNYLLYIFDT